MVRLFSGGYSTILAVIAAFFATLYVYDADPETWKTEISGTYSHSPQVLFQFLTDPKNILQVYIIVKNILSLSLLLSNELPDPKIWDLI